MPDCGALDYIMRKSDTEVLKTLISIALRLGNALIDKQVRFNENLRLNEFHEFNLRLEDEVNQLRKENHFIKKDMIKKNKKIQKKETLLNVQKSGINKEIKQMENLVNSLEENQIDERHLTQFLWLKYKEVEEENQVLRSNFQKDIVMGVKMQKMEKEFLRMFDNLRGEYTKITDGFKHDFSELKIVIGAMKEGIANNRKKNEGRLDEILVEMKQRLDRSDKVSRKIDLGRITRIRRNFIREDKQYKKELASV